MKNLSFKKNLSLQMLLLGSCLLMALGCTKDNNLKHATVDSKTQSRSAVPILTPKIDISPDNDHEKMYEDGESMAEMTSEDRRFDVSSVLRTKPINDTTIELSNFAPTDIIDATILIKIAGIDQKIKLYNCTIKAHTIKRIPYPFINGQTTFMTYGADSTEVDLSPYKTIGIAPSKVSFEFTGTTSLIAKLLKLKKMKWKVKMVDFNPNNIESNWLKEPTAKQFRMFVSFMINFAFFYQDEATLIALTNEPILDNGGTKYLLPSRIKADFIRVQNRTNFNCGLTDTRKIQGLGGGTVFGMPDWVVLSFMSRIYSTPIHEMGHILGYGHSSSMTNNIGGYGAPHALVPLWERKVKEGDFFPILKTNYYLTSDIPPAT